MSSELVYDDLSPVSPPTPPPARATFDWIVLPQDLLSMCRHDCKIASLCVETRLKENRFPFEFAPSQKKRAAGQGYCIRRQFWFSEHVLEAVLCWAEPLEIREHERRRECVELINLGEGMRIESSVLKSRRRVRGSRLFAGFFSFVDDHAVWGLTEFKWLANRRCCLKFVIWLILNMHNFFYNCWNA